MRDERVAELMKQSVAGKEPREGWEQGVLAAAIRPRLHSPFRWALVAVAAPFVLFCGIGYYMWSHHESEKAALIAQRQSAERARAFAEHRAKELQQQIAAIEREQSDLEARLVLAKTEAQRAAIQRQMEANKARVRGLKDSGGFSGGAKVMIGGGDSTDPLQGIK
jgi:hypothetical protein